MARTERSSPVLSGLAGAPQLTFNMQGARDSSNLEDRRGMELPLPPWLRLPPYRDYDNFNVGRRKEPPQKKLPDLLEEALRRLREPEIDIHMDGYEPPAPKPMPPISDFLQPDESLFSTWPPYMQMLRQKR